MVLTLFLPLLTSVLSGLFFRKRSAVASFLTTAGVFFSFCAACFIFFEININKSSPFDLDVAHFITFSDFTSSWTLFADGLVSIMIVVVTFVSLLVHIYSVSYMHEDKSLTKFMSFLSLFTFFMLILLTAKDFLQMFVGWEGVGLCSYLLIGFWNEKKEANDAAIKAFITNRVADLAFILAICITYYIFGSLNFEFIKTSLFNQNVSPAFLNYSIFGIETSFISLIALLLFIGAMGKSAQIFLHVWLPDAMEGPTPVSALIHAATMVTAGVFLIAKLSFLFEFSGIVKNVIVVIGSMTAFFAATIALTQNDIKKIIAYSTCSQLGYMFVASGLSAYSAGIFHLVTHAFFKALLFLAAGSVIHAMSGEQDITKMGALAKKIPITFVCVLIGSIAIAGIPPFSGYFSKDAILEVSFMKNGFIGMFAFTMLLISAFMTAIYSWRLIILVFNGSKTNNTKEVVSHIHESSYVMLIPLILLSIFAVISGFVLEHYFHILSDNGIFSKSIIVLPENNVISNIHNTPFIVKILPTIASALAIICAYFLFLKSRRIKLPTFIFNFVKNKYYFDELYNIIFIKPIKSISTFFIKTFDKSVLDKIFTSVPSYVSILISRCFATLQGGMIVVYLSFIVVSIVAIFLFLILKYNIL